MAHNFLLNFAKDNELQVRSGRGEKRPGEGQQISPAAPA
jgi:hypothetical protein